MAAALALHGGLGLALSRLPAASPPTLQAAEPAPLAVELLAPAEPAAPEPASPAAAEDAPPPGLPDAGPSLPSRRVAPAPAALSAAVVDAPAPSSSAAVPDAFAATSEGPGADDRQARGRRAVAGLFQGAPWLLGPGGVGATGERAEGPAGPRAEDPDRAGKLLRESMGRADQAKGLGFGGPVASAAYGAALGKAAPVQGAATFEVRVDASGALVAIAVRDASGGDWTPVVASLQAALAGRKLGVPQGTSGAVVTVRVEARHQLPSGRSPGKAVDVGRKGIGVGGSFDLADLSGQVSRVVSARVLGERTLDAR